MKKVHKKLKKFYKIQFKFQLEIKNFSNKMQTVDRIRLVT